MKKQRSSEIVDVLWALFVVSAAVVALLLAPRASASGPEVPDRMALHGWLTTAGGEPLDDLVSLWVALYDAADQGDLLYWETLEQVPVEAGRFAVEVGAAGGFTDGVASLAELFNVEAGIWVGLAVDGGAELPRRRLGSGGFSFRAATAATAEGVSCDGCVGGVALADGSIGVGHLGVACAPGEVLGQGSAGWGCVEPVAPGSVGFAELAGGAMTGLVLNPDPGFEAPDALAAWPAHPASNESPQPGVLAAAGAGSVTFQVSTLGGASLAQGGPWPLTGGAAIRLHARVLRSDLLLDEATPPLAILRFGDGQGHPVGAAHALPFPPDEGQPGFALYVSNAVQVPEGAREVLVEQLGLPPGSLGAMTLDEVAVVAYAPLLFDQFLRADGGSLSGDLVLDGDAALVCDGCVSAETVASGAIGAEALASGAVGAEALAPAAVGPDHLAPGCVGPEALAPAAVELHHLAGTCAAGTILRATPDGWGCDEAVPDDSVELVDLAAGASAALLLPADPSFELGLEWTTHPASTLVPEPTSEAASGLLAMRFDKGDDVSGTALLMSPLYDLAGARGVRLSLVLERKSLGAPAGEPVEIAALGFYSASGAQLGPAAGLSLEAPAGGSDADWVALSRFFEAPPGAAVVAIDRLGLPAGVTGSVVIDDVDLAALAPQLSDQFLRPSGGTLHGDLQLVQGAAIACDGCVHAAALAPGAVGGAQLFPGAVGPSHLAKGAVTGPAIANATITAPKLAGDSVTSSHIAANAVQSAELAAATVSTGHLVDGAVTGPKVSPGAIGTAHLAAGSVQAPQIAGSSVTRSHLAGSEPMLFRRPEGCGASLTTDPDGCTTLQCAVAYEVPFFLTCDGVCASAAPLPCGNDWMTPVGYLLAL